MIEEILIIASQKVMYMNYSTRSEVKRRIDMRGNRVLYWS